MSQTKTARPKEIKLHQASRKLEIVFEDGNVFLLPCEYLRISSPSVEIRALGELPVYKEEVNLSKVEPIGNYAVRLYFDDGYKSGIYSWQALYELGINQEKNWKDYLERLAKSGYRRRDTSV